MIQTIKPNNKVLIIPHKDNTHPELVGEKGIVRLIYKDLYYIQTDNYFKNLPPYKELNIPQGYCYVSVYEELALIE